MAIGVLVALIFSKYFYLASLTSYYTFYLIEQVRRLGADARRSHLFVFLGAVAAGTILGGPIGDRFGRKLVIWVLDPRRAAVHAAAALRQPVLDAAC